MDKRETRARYVEFAGTKGTVSILCCRFILKGIVSGSRFGHSSDVVVPYFVHSCDLFRSRGRLKRDQRKI